MRRTSFYPLLAAVLFWSAALNLSAQGTALAYQGRLNDSGAPATGSYDFRFAVFSAPTNGAAVSVSVTNFAVPVTNGLFTATLDFGPGVFNGTANGSNDWLDVAVRPAGGSSFTTLLPRQPILPVPYALFAVSASNLLGALPATQLVGTVASGQLSGTYSNVFNFANPTNAFAGMFTGIGLSLSNLNAANVTVGTLADARLNTNVAFLNLNQTYSSANTYNGASTFNASQTFNGTNFFTGPNTFTGSNTFTGVNMISNNGNYFVGSFFGNGLVGWLPVYAAATNAMRDAGYLTLNPGVCAVTLPATSSLLVGDIVRVSGGGGGWRAVVNSGQKIIGNFASYGNAFTTAIGRPLSDCRGFASSTDGRRMYGVGLGVTGVFASVDGGNNWYLVSTNNNAGIPGPCSSVACSASGQIVYAEDSTGGKVRESNDGGMTWTVTSYTATGTFITCTADGSTPIVTNVACSGNGTYRARLSGGSILVSTNGGAGWNVSVTGPTTGLTCLGASADCTHLIAGVSNGMLYATSDLGHTWTTVAAAQPWSSAWMSADGSRFGATFAAIGSLNGGIFGGAASPLPGTATSSSGSVSGSQGSAVELQYIGNGQFVPAGSTGPLWAN